MTDLPNGWEHAPIGSLCTLNNGRAFKPSEWQVRGIPIVRIQNLNNPSAPYNHFLGEYDARYHLRGGELLFAWSGTPGTSFGAHVWRGGEAVLNQHIFRVDFDEGMLDKRYFQHAINQKLNELIGVAHGGVGLRHVTKGKFEQTHVAVPPLNEQKRIADKLDAVLARVDACRERLDRVPDILKRFRQAVLAAAVSGDVTEEWRERGGISKAWLESDVQSVSQVGTGSTPLRSNASFYADQGTPWITSAATSRPFVLSATQFVTDAAVQAHRLKTYPIGTLLVAMYGEGKTRGQISELCIEATINQACAAIVVDEAITLRAFLKLVLQANYLEMRELAEGGNQPNLNLSKIKEFPVLLPSLDEQHEIVRRVESLFAYVDRLEARYAAARAQVERLTPALLARAFRGELVPQDPNDEPGSVLLECIRAARAAVPAKPRRGRSNLAAPNAPTAGPT